MRIAIFLRQHSAFHEIAALLEDSGVEVELLYPEDGLTELTALRPEHDLYVLKARTHASLSLAGALHLAGAAILNPYPLAAACRDKIMASQLLRGAGVPVPETYVAGTPSLLAPLLDSAPLVVKPYRGSQGAGVRVVRASSELQGDNGDEGPFYAQRYYAPSGRDRKIYRIGDRIYGVKRVWPARTSEQKLGEPFEVVGELRDIALRLGSALGLSLYGFDVVETDAGPYVVDFSPFPGFKGVPEAPELLAEYIAAATRRAVAGEPVTADRAFVRP